MDLGALRQGEDFFDLPVIAVFRDAHHATAVAVAAGEENEFLRDFGRERDGDAVEIGVRLPEHLAGGGRNADGGAEFEFTFPFRRDEDSLLDAVEIQDRRSRVGIAEAFGAPDFLARLGIESDESNLGGHRRHDEDIPHLHDALRPSPLGRFGPILLLDRDDPVSLVRLAIDPEDLAEAADEIDGFVLDERHPAAAGKR